MSALDARLRLGGQWARQASDMALGYFRKSGLAVGSKGPGDLVTEADFAIERMLRDAIDRHFPGDAVIGEEFGGTAGSDNFAWLVDPVDGTVNFARGIAYFCVSIALLDAGRPVAAWIADPVLGEMFHADPAGRAVLNGDPIRCADQAEMSEAVIGLGFSARHDRGLVPHLPGAIAGDGGEFRRLGAGALCLAHVAAGRLDAYVEPHMNPWDAVGGLYIARCAGAACLDYVAAGGLASGAPVFAASPAIAHRLMGLLPAPFTGTPLHLDNVQRSAGQAATTVASSTPTPETKS